MMAYPFCFGMGNEERGEGCRLMCLRLSVAVEVVLPPACRRPSRPGFREWLG
jgi:hypothetical protein